MWVINSTKIILSSEINIRLVTKIFHCKFWVKRFLMDFEMKSLHEAFVYDLEMVWFGRKYKSKTTLQWSKFMVYG